MAGNRKKTVSNLKETTNRAFDFSKEHCKYE